MPIQSPASSLAIANPKSVSRVIHVAPAVPAGNISEWSWWRENVNKDFGVPLPPFKGGANFDVVIVGGGFTGLWTALTLKERNPDLSVAILEAYRLGDGASSRNGGIVHGYWQSLASNIRAFGTDAALDLALLGSKAQQSFKAYASEPGRNVDWKEAGNLRVATCAAQEKSLADFLQKCQGLGVEKYIQPLNSAQVSEIIGSKVFGNGIFFPEAGNVHPGKLVLALKRSVIEAGVKIFEQTQVERIDPGQGGLQRVQVKDGILVTPQVVLATNVGLSQLPGLGSKLSIFSSFATMSNPCEAALDQLNWQQPVGVNDARMFLHYFRKTADNRVLMGSGSGPIGFTRDASNPRLRNDSSSLQRAKSGMARLLPAVSSSGFAKTWGWPIDVSADRVPFFGTLRPGVHYGGGFSGHGVQATWIAGQCLSSLVMGAKDEWSQSIFCRRAVPNLPPEPIKYMGANAIRWGVLNCEEAEQLNRRGNLSAQGLAALPNLLGLRIGVR